jgi:hypothetical protein
MDFDKILEKFPESLRDKFAEVCDHLEEEGTLSEDSEKDFTALILEFMDKTSSDENSIMKTSYVLANAFKEYKFDERIQRSIEIFCELQIPSDFQEGKEFELWDKARDYLLKLLDEEELIEESDDDLDLDLD